MRHKHPISDYEVYMYTIRMKKHSSNSNLFMIIYKTIMEAMYVWLHVYNKNEEKFVKFQFIYDNL